MQGQISKRRNIYEVYLRINTTIVFWLRNRLPKSVVLPCESYTANFAISARVASVGSIV